MVKLYLNLLSPLLFFLSLLFLCVVPSLAQMDLLKEEPSRNEIILLGSTEDAKQDTSASLRKQTFQQSSASPEYRDLKENISSAKVVHSKDTSIMHTERSQKRETERNLAQSKVEQKSPEERLEQVRARLQQWGYISPADDSMYSNDLQKQEVNCKESSAKSLSQACLDKSYIQEQDKSRIKSYVRFLAPLIILGIKSDLNKSSDENGIWLKDTFEDDIFGE